VVGAGSMGALALATLGRLGAGPLVITNRSAAKAAKLAETYGATAVPLAELTAQLRTVDVVVCATASVGPVLTAGLVAPALADRTERPLSIVDLAVPRDVLPEVGDLPGVMLIDLDVIATANHDAPSAADRDASEAIVAAEVEAFQTWRRGAEVAPAVAALRARADEVVAAELRRLWQRQPDLTEDQRAELSHTLHRVVQRLLHKPTVRMRELAASPDGGTYLAVLREVLDLQAEPEGLDRAVTVRPDDDAEGEAS
jgi:glutamyl-tRNA reductase